MFLVEKRETKDKSVLVKVTPTQHAKIREMAIDREMTVSEMVMWLIELEFNSPALLNSSGKKATQGRLL